MKPLLDTGNEISLSDHPDRERPEILQEIVREVEEAWSDIRDHDPAPAPGRCHTLMERLEGSDRIRRDRMDDAVNRLRLWLRAVR